MTQLSLEDATAIYDCASRAVLAARTVRHSGFRRYCMALATLQRQLRDEEDPFWSGILQALRRVRFTWTASPLPFNHPDLIDPALHRTVAARLADATAAYPNFAPPFKAVLEALTELSHLDDNPLLDTLLALQAEDEANSIGILIKVPRLTSAIEAALAGHQTLEGCNVVMPNELADCVGYDRLAVIGPARWFPDSVLSAPRAREVVIIRYAWITDTWNLEPLFIGPGASRPDRSRQRVDPPSITPADADIALDAADLLPTVDWRTVAASEAKYAPAAFDDVTARPFLLEDNHVVFLDADDATTALVIDLAAHQTERVRRLPVADLVPGLFLLLRTEGGSDYVVDVANHILGAGAGSDRARQFSWKEGLRRVARDRGLIALTAALRAAGSPRASETNVRNWMSARTICPDDHRDFAAIMQVTGQAARADEYLQAMQRIDRAHLMAGQRIRQMLLRQVRSADLRVLEREGRMDFSLTNADGGRLTAFRVIEPAPETIRVPISRIGHPFPLESAQWRE